MEIVLNSIVPVFLLIALGAFLKHFHVTSEAFLKTSDKLIYYIFFPAMLFWKIGAPSSASSIDWKLSLAVLCAVSTVYVLSTIFVRIIRAADFDVGSFSQSCYRFNTYVGMAIVLTALGDEGVRQFAVMIGIAIPFINLLAVSTLIWYSGADYGSRERVAMVAKASFSNPLILGCLLGIAYSRLGLPLPVFAHNTFHLLSMVSLPMALISVGGSLNLSQLKGNLKMATAATLCKLLLLPLAGYLFLRACGVGALPFKVGMVFFTLPTSTAVYILSSQLHSNTNLAAASIVLSTVFSVVSLSLSLALFAS